MYPFMHDDSGMYRDDPINWSNLIYQVSRKLTQQEVDSLTASMRNRYGADARLEVEYQRDRDRLHFRNGEINDLAAMAEYKQLTAQLIGDLQANPQLLYPS